MHCSLKNLRFGQATKGVWWMPWGKEPMKDAVSGETRRGGANIFDPAISEWGNPAQVMLCHRILNS